MDYIGRINRRGFIKSSVLTGGALMARSVMPARAVALMQGQGSKAAGAATGDGMLKGVCDIHLHCRPDSRERSADEFGFMQDAVRAGYRAVMFKSNDFSCHDRAYIIRQALPGAQCFGSVCMNRVHGDKVNVFAAQKAVQTSGGLCRCIWMPTLDAAYHCRCEGRATGCRNTGARASQSLPHLLASTRQGASSLPTWARRSCPTRWRACAIAFPGCRAQA